MDVDTSRFVKLAQVGGPTPELSLATYKGMIDVGKLKRDLEFKAMIENGVCGQGSFLKKIWIPQIYNAIRCNTKSLDCIDINREENTLSRVFANIVMKVSVSNLIRKQSKR